MGGQTDHATGKKPSLIKRLAHLGERPLRPRTNDKDKVVYYSSDLFNASMMVDATRHNSPEPLAHREDEETKS